MANDQEVVSGARSERGLQLLLAFGEQHRDLTFAELHRLVDMPKRPPIAWCRRWNIWAFLSATPAPIPFAGHERTASGL